MTSLTFKCDNFCCSHRTQIFTNKKGCDSMPFIPGGHCGLEVARAQRQGGPGLNPVYSSFFKVRMKD